MERCSKCGGILVEVAKERILPNPEFENLSDEEMIDFFAEEISGDYREWGRGRVTCVCAQCGEKTVVAGEEGSRP